MRKDALYGGGISGFDEEAPSYIRQERYLTDQEKALDVDIRRAYSRARLAQMKTPNTAVQEARIQRRIQERANRV